MLGVWGLGFGVWGLGLRVWSSASGGAVSRVSGFGIRVHGGSRIQRFGMSEE